MADGERLRADAAAIRDAAIESVQPERLFASRLALMDGALLCDGRPLAPPLDLDAAGRVVVVGAGKAAAGMAAGVETLLGADRLRRHTVTGLVSVPAGCGRTLGRIEVRETRPAAANLPTEAVVAATGEMLGLLHGLGSDDVALAVISGGGSALLCQPRPGVPLAEKVAVARFLSAAGADIHELNTLRQAASVVKGGGLARACRAGRLLVLVLSDVIGDPLDVIASGPCMPVATAPRQALAVLERFGAVEADVAPALVTALRADVAREQAAAVSEPAGASAGASAGAPAGAWTTPGTCAVTHLVLGGNHTAVAAAATRARDLGYAVTARRARPDSVAETAAAVGRRLAADARALASAARYDGVPRALIEGGEATVALPADHGTGGRNQQAVVAAITALLQIDGGWPAGLLLASIGTDGEDGPTQAAGGLADADVVGALDRQGSDPLRTLIRALDRALDRCDALPLLASAGGLVVTGPTGTNVADVRIILARPPAAGPALGTDGTCGSGCVTSRGA
jgi:hydroxypyruvate reductase